MSKQIGAGNPIAVILLGASVFPHSEKISSQTAFSNSAMAFREYLQTRLPDSEILWLFDDSSSVIEQDESIANFLEINNSCGSIVCYYVGHGGFLADREYFLAIQATKKNREHTTGFRIKALAQTLNQAAASKNLFLILDCCFAGEAVKEFQSIEIGKLVQEETFAAFPAVGTALLVAASKDEPAISPMGHRFTMFSESLIDVLKMGIPCKGKKLSLSDVGLQTRVRIRGYYGLEAVLPEIHSPRQTGIDVAMLPIFPNPSFGTQPAPRRVASSPTIPEHRLTVLEPKTAIAIGGLVFRYIPASTFCMGSDDGYKHERPKHRVRTSSFFLQDTPLTTSSFRRFREWSDYRTMAERGYPTFCWIGNTWVPITGPDWEHPLGAELGTAKRDDHPVVHVTWYDAAMFCRWMSETSGFEVTLPTEAQWENAACGGQRIVWPFGNEYIPGKANILGPDLTAVRRYPPTAFQLFDMVGNVYQWCRDWYSPKWQITRDSLDEPTRDPGGPSTGRMRLLRGGSWVDEPKHCRCANRFHANPTQSAANWGFRCAVTLDDRLVDALLREPLWGLHAQDMLAEE
jgi:formylglycine-generating enzyme